MKEKQKNREKKEAVAQLRSKMTDPQGCYTGVPANPYETPTQDQDDL